MIPEPVKRIECVRCGVEVNPVMARYLWVGTGERGASRFGKQGNTVFGRRRETKELCFCGPCGDQVRQMLQEFVLRTGRHAGLDSFARGVVRD